MRSLPPECIELARLPSTSSDLFGRDEELVALDKAWEDGDTNVVTLVAFGGVGKTALVNGWLGRMRAARASWVRCSNDLRASPE